jgi:HTH-type transcriptional regulator / antitoxin HigA
MSRTLADPAEMIRRGAPRLLRSDEELAEYTRTLFSLTSKPKPTALEQEAIDLLTLLIEQYETTRYPLPQARAVEVLRLLMERNSVSQGKITPELGFQASASLILLGKRQLNRGHIARLSQRFKVSPALFFDEKSTVALRLRKKKKARRPPKAERPSFTQDRLRPPLRAMQHANNVNRVRADYIHYDPGQRRQHQFPRSPSAAGSVDHRQSQQNLRRAIDRAHQTSRMQWSLLRKIIGNALQISGRRLRPSQQHQAVRRCVSRSSIRRPNSSWLRTAPRSRSAKPFSTSATNHAS